MVSENTSATKKLFNQRNKDFSSIKGILHSGLKYKGSRDDSESKAIERNIESNFIDNSRNKHLRYFIALWL